MLYICMLYDKTKYWEGTDSFSFVQIDQATLRIQNLKLLERRSLFRKGGYVYYSSYFSDSHRVIFLITNGNTGQSWYIILPIAVLIPESLVCLKSPTMGRNCVCVCVCVCVYVCVCMGYIDKICIWEVWDIQSESPFSNSYLTAKVWYLLAHTSPSYMRLVR